MWSSQLIYWRDFLDKHYNTTVSCKTEDQIGPPFKMQMDATLLERREMMNYPEMNICLSPPLELENLLPYGISFKIVDKTTGQDWGSILEQGASIPVHMVQIGHLLMLRVEIPDTEYTCAHYAIISTNDPEEYPLDDVIVMKDRGGLRMNLRIDRYVVPNAGGACRFALYSPYVMINKTGLRMRFKTKSLVTSATAVAGQSSDTDTVTKPFMFGYPSSEPRNRGLIKVGDSAWSKPLSFEAVGSVSEVVIPKEGSGATANEEIHIGIQVSEGEGVVRMHHPTQPQACFSMQLNCAVCCAASPPSIDCPRW